MKTLEDFFSQVLKDIIVDKSIQVDENGNEYVAKDSVFNQYLGQILGTVLYEEEIKELAKKELVKALKSGLSKKYVLEVAIEKLMQTHRSIFDDEEIVVMSKKIVKDFLKTKKGKEMLANNIINDMGKWDKWRAESYAEKILGIKDN